MALKRNDTGKFYRDQDDVDNDTPVSCSIIGTAGGLSLFTHEDPGVPYGPQVDGYNPTQNPTPVADVGLGVPGPYSVQIADAIGDAAALAASATASASLSELLAKGLLLPIGLSAGQSDDGWQYDRESSVWSRRFANDTLYFTLSAYGSAITNLRVLVRDVNAVGGGMIVSAAWFPRTETGPKAKTFSNSATSAADGTVQLLDIPTTNIPSLASEMQIKVTTGSAIAPVATPYQLLQCYWLPE